MLETPTSPPAAEARAQCAAQQTGIAPAEVEQFPFDLSALEAEGIFVVRRATGR